LKKKSVLKRKRDGLVKKRNGMEKSFYITTTLPYVNADPHVGFALEIVSADILARYHVLNGDEVFFNTGTDEHGIKIYRKAQEGGVEPQAYVDEYAEKFKRLQPALNLWEGLNFIRTTDERHKKAAQEFWKRCDASGDIYKKNYKVKYCVGCELEKTDSELNEKGCCSLHSNQELEIIDEENYFFRFSKYQKPLLELYERQPDFVVPDFRFNEIKALAERGLKDFSISRLKEKMPWGVAVPGDDEHVMFVWFDALVNYISTVGWPDDMKKFEMWWPVVQLAGKDQIRQQAAMWQAMLLSAGLSPSKQIVIHGFITSGGEKMSKSIGNVVDPFKIIDEYGTDALRYYLARHVHPFEDSDFTMEKFREVYNANLANGLGNLVSRVMKMAETHLQEPVVVGDGTFSAQGGPASGWSEVTKGEYEQLMGQYEIQKTADIIWKRIGELDVYVQETQPFKTIKEDEDKAKNDIVYLVNGLMGVARMLMPFLPETAEKIKKAIAENKAPEPLFVRIPTVLIKAD